MQHERFASNTSFDTILKGDTVLKRGDKGPAVTAVQQALEDMGFPMTLLKDGIGFSGVDSVFGGQTETALKNFQVHACKKHDGLSVNGVVDAPTLRALIALTPAPGRKAWDEGQPNHAPVSLWNGNPAKKLVVIVVQDEHRTFLYDAHGKCTGIFPNAQGAAAHSTDSGLKKVRTKLGEAAAKATGKELWNVERAFGKRIVDLCWESGKSHGEELHGTYDYQTMGTDVSHGCVRHYNEDIIKVFDAVTVGDLVAIVPSIDDPRLR